MNRLVSSLIFRLSFHWIVQRKKDGLLARMSPRAFVTTLGADTTQVEGLHSNRIGH